MALQVVGELLAAEIGSFRWEDRDIETRELTVFGAGKVVKVRAGDSFSNAEFAKLMAAVDKRPHVVLDVSVSKKGGLYLDCIVSAQAAS